jgi:hypothetical protein
MLSLFGLGRFIRTLGRVIFGWAVENPGWAIAAVLSAVLAWMTLVTIPGHIERTEAAIGRYEAEAAAHDASIASWVAARKAAAELDRQNVERVRGEYAAQFERVKNENATLRADLHGALANRLRGSRTATVDNGGGGNAQLSIISDLPGGLVQGSGAAIISNTDALICADNHAQLVGIIAAWRAAAGVDVNGR